MFLILINTFDCKKHIVTMNYQIIDPGKLPLSRSNFIVDTQFKVFVGCKCMMKWK
jgi:hypothetical protein